MDENTRYSALTVAPDTGIEAAIKVLDSLWIYPFCSPTSIQFDQAFNIKEFDDFLSLHNIISRSIPARRHNRNVIDSKHSIIRDIFFRIKKV